MLAESVGLDDVTPRVLRRSADRVAGEAAKKLGVTQPGSPAERLAVIADAIRDDLLGPITK